MSSLNFNYNINPDDNPQIGKKNTPNNEDKNTIRYNSQNEFVNSIMGDASKYLGKTELKALQNNAITIFNQFDNSPKDNKWNTTEERNGFSALNSIKSAVQNAIKQATSAVNVNKTQDVSDISEVSKADKANNVQTTQDIEDNRIGEILQQNVQRFMDENNISQIPNIKELNNATTALMKGITKGVATDNNGKDVPFVINLNTGEISKISANEAQQVDNIIKSVNNKAETLNKVLNLNDVLDKYAQKGFQPVGTPEQKTVNGQQVLIGTLRNSSGEEVKINLKTGEEIKE